MVKGIQIVASGDTVENAKDDDFVVNTKKESGFKIFREYVIRYQDLTYNPSSGLYEVEVPHNMGFAPAFLAFYSELGAARLAGSIQAYALPIDAVQVTDRVIRAAMQTADSAVVFTVKIFGERLNP